MSVGKGKSRFAGLRRAFAIRRQEDASLTPRQDEILDRLSAKVVEWDMAAPAILFLETVKPLNYVGSQALVFFGPIAKTLFTVEDYEELVSLMEERSGVESLLTRIEEKQAARGSRLR
jgi:hypothetical protein